MERLSHLEISLKELGSEPKFSPVPTTDADASTHPLYPGAHVVDVGASVAPPHADAHQVEREIAEHHDHLSMVPVFQEGKVTVGEAREQRKMSFDQPKKIENAEKKVPKQFKHEVEMDDHQVPVDELAARLKSSVAAGLTSAIAQQKLQEFGPNALTPPKTTPEWVKIMKAYFEGFFIMLWIAVILCFLAYGLDRRDNGDAADLSNLYLAGALLITIIATGTYGYLQDRSSSKLMEGFQSLLPSLATVTRDGKKCEINARDLVPGDVVHVVGGNKIPADIRVVECSNFKVDNSSLTGESEPQSRSAECTDNNPFETKNLAFFGTLAVEGSATGIVIMTGDSSMIGRIASLASNVEDQTSTLDKEVHHFIRIIMICAVIVGAVFCGIGFTVWNPIYTLVFGIGIVVAMVPEGMVATVLVSLSVAAKRMAQKNVLIKKLQFVETLGSCNVICSDKTGTLTQNRMTVVSFYYDRRHISARKGSPGEPFKPEDPSFQMTYKCMALNSKATFVPDDMSLPIEDRRTLGDATETGLIRFCEAVEPLDPFRARFTKVCEVPFNSKYKYAISITTEKTDSAVQRRGRFTLWMKGAPEKIIERCATIMQNGVATPLSEEVRKQLNDAYEEIGGRGERVIGLAYLDLDEITYPASYKFDPEQQNFPNDGLTFLGLASLIDPPRDTVPHAIERCHTAGIRVIMVTGDHPITARAIARQVGIIRSDTVDDIAKRRGIPKEQAVVVPGWEISALSDQDWDRVLSCDQIVFARTTPQHKLIIVEELQKRGNIVAMTGDGVNDSPSLKKADIGVAMGITGSDVSKEAAKMILLDDNFASIVNGVEEGRLVFDNLKKSIAYYFSHIPAEVVMLLLFFAVRIPVPITTILIFMVDLISDVFPALSLAYEEPEADIMTRPPRNAKRDRLVGKSLFFYSYVFCGGLILVGTVVSYFTVVQLEGLTLNQLPGLAANWEKKDADLTLEQRAAFVDKDGLFIDKARREHIGSMCCAAVFMSIMIGQYGVLVTSKTLKRSIFAISHWYNKALLISVAFETVIWILMLYAPGVQDVFKMPKNPSFHFQYILLSVPSTLLIIALDEGRKWHIRTHPGGFFDRWTSF